MINKVYIFLGALLIIGGIVLIFFSINIDNKLKKQIVVSNQEFEVSNDSLVDPETKIEFKTPVDSLIQPESIDKPISSIEIKKEAEIQEELENSSNITKKITLKKDSILNENFKDLDKKYLVVVGSFKVEQNAINLVEELKAIGFELSFIYKADENFTCAVVNCFASRKQANEFLINSKLEGWVKKK